MMRYFKLFSLVFGLMSLMVFSSCDESSLDDPSNGRAQLEVRLIDGPADYDAVLVDIIDVQIKYADGEWTSLDMVNPDTYDLLKLTAGVDALLGETELPAGELQEIRLILGDGNFLEIDGEMIDLDTPSAQQSGLKVKVEEPLEEGVSYTLVLDWEAGPSIVEAGASGKYILKPVIRASLMETDVQEGAEIAGILTPAEAFYLELIPEMGDPLTTYANEETGAFLFTGLEPGTYSLEINGPSMTSYEQKIITDIVVEEGGMVDLGEIEMNP
ncbi:DUF4382 domain-containing protein [Flavilitoribacter nigricans]|nr:DUF4382 domain-containing protein [Flavilitoribacter nigricans]